MKKILSNVGLVSCCVLFSAAVSQSKAQTRTITGQVNDSDNPLSEVTVTQEGTNQAAITSASGTFRLQITGENAVLLFRHPEYGERKISADGKSTFTITLTPKVKAIEEVVLNAGYYNVKAKESTASISKVTAKDIENQPVNNVLSAVQGRMAGVNITQNSGNAGGGYDVQIRGRNSLRNSINSLNDGNQPLYVIDGVPFSGQLTSTYSVGVLPLKNISPLNSINPNDIESIEVLKDADATAIYGSRGGNGVILITTKRGKAEPVQLTLNSSQSYSKVASTLKMMSSEEYIAMRKQAFYNAGITTYPDYAYDINGAWDQARSTDWQKELIGKTAQNSNVQLSVAGGSERNTFSISAAHQDQTTVFPGEQHYKTNTFSSHYRYNSLNQGFMLELSNITSFTSNNNLNTDYTRSALNLAPNAPALYDEAGNLNWQNSTFGNPLALLKASYSNKTKLINQNLTVSYKPWSDFSVKLNSGLTLQDLEEFSISPNTMYNPASVSSTSSAYSSSSRGTASVFSYLIEPQLSWVKTYDQHELNALVGATFQQSLSQSTAMRGTGFASNALLHNIAAATTITLSPFNDVQYRYLAFFGRLNYQYKDRYILNLTARRDGSSRFGPNQRFANFGAVGTAWIISEESFLKNLRWLSFAKLRGSYGKTGSDAIGDFQFTNTYTLASSSYNNIPGLYPSRLYNPFFSWEKTTKLEAALDLSFWNNRLSLNTAWYRNRSSNQLVGIPLPATTGFTSIQANLAATVQNTGLETELNIIPFKAENWKWTANFNISIPTNKLLAFPGLEGSTYANTYVVGKSIYAVKLLNYEGINASTGQYTFTDYNNDGKITTPDDAQTLRNLGPKYFGGFQNAVSYKNFNFSFLLQFVKQDGYNYFKNMGTPGNMGNQPVELLNVWSPNNLSGLIMPYSPGTDAAYNTLNNNFKNSTAAVSDASYIRLKNVQLNYKIPVHANVLKEAMIYAQGQNIWTWTKYFGLDPEFMTSGFLPPLKTFSLGLQLTF